MRAETRQRQDALDALSGEVDWVLQLDNDEYLPDPQALLSAIEEAERRGIGVVEWPMRVLFRRTRMHMFEIAGPSGQAWFEYPGPVAVRPEVRLAQARRTDAPFLRPVVAGDKSSLQVVRPAANGEHRWEAVTLDQAIIHDSWARSPREILQKTRSWGHANGWRSVVYYLAVWLPIPLTWRWARDVHPFSRGVWPRVIRRAILPEERD
jgi:hypothetical protein